MRSSWLKFLIGSMPKFFAIQHTEASGNISISVISAPVPSTTQSRRNVNIIPNMIRLHQDCEQSLPAFGHSSKNTPKSSINSCIPSGSLDFGRQSTIGVCGVELLGFICHEHGSIPTITSIPSSTRFPRLHEWFAYVCIPDYTGDDLFLGRYLENLERPGSLIDGQYQQLRKKARQSFMRDGYLFKRDRIRGQIPLASYWLGVLVEYSDSRFGLLLNLL